MVITMVTFEECGEMLDEIADSIPNELYRKLNGGIILQPELKVHPKAVDNDLFILGEYRRDNLGRYIVIFYGSFQRVYGHLPPDKFKERLEHTLVHEIRHHNEFLAGYKDLIVYDDERIARYLESKEKTAQRKPCGEQSE